MLTCPADKTGTDKDTIKTAANVKLTLDTFSLPYYIPELTDLKKNLGYVWTGSKGSVHVY